MNEKIKELDKLIKKIECLTDLNRYISFGKLLPACPPNIEEFRDTLLLCSKQFKDIIEQIEKQKPAVCVSVYDENNDSWYAESYYKEFWSE